MDSTQHWTAVCVGEILWDVFPDSRRLGGAPFNVACHLRTFGIEPYVVSRIGNDELGREIRSELLHREISVETLQMDPTLPTGVVDVRLDAMGRPSFTIHAPAAWDAITLEDRARTVAEQAHVIVFGTLAQRRDTSRSTIRRLLNTRAVKVLDVNVRPPYDFREVVVHSLHRANVVKVNETELETLASLFEIDGTPRDQCEELTRRFGLETVCVTRGELGAALWHNGNWYEHQGYRVNVIDTVGSGDAFLAGLIWGLLHRQEPSVALRYANAAGALVASRAGATPELAFEEVECLARSS